MWVNSCYNLWHIISWNSVAFCLFQFFNKIFGIITKSLYSSKICLLLKRQCSVNGKNYGVDKRQQNAGSHHVQQMPGRVEEIILGESASISTQQNSCCEEEHSTHCRKGEGRPVSQIVFEEVSSCDEDPVRDDVPSKGCVHDHDMVEMFVGQACMVCRRIDQDDTDEADQLEVSVNIDWLIWKMIRFYIW